VRTGPHPLRLHSRDGCGDGCIGHSGGRHHRPPDGTRRPAVAGTCWRYTRQATPPGRPLRQCAEAGRYPLAMPGPAEATSGRHRSAARPGSRPGTVGPPRS